ncbi:MAG: hypothetical protein H6Q42_2420 [Deltaproteobacteria bacterium]|jgi:hypothetical protein|nr:hypothetical protein [Deltaproteobacteria bacterium]
MTAFVLLLICVAAQVLIAAGLGIYFLRGYLKKRRGEEAPPPESKVPPAPH